MQHLTIHGIGDTHSGQDYLKRWHVPESLGIPSEDVVPFWYEDIMDGDNISWLTRMTAKALARIHAPKFSYLIERPVDYLEDIFVFFLSSAAREAIKKRLDDFIPEHQNKCILAHSLGSVIIYWYFCMNPTRAVDVELVTMGSPLGAPLLKALIYQQLRRILPGGLIKIPVMAWYNIASECDPLSGYINSSLGCKDASQRRLKFVAKVFHAEVDEYLKAFRMAFLGQAAA